MRKSPLNPLHERLGARMTHTDGWSMPHTFSNLLEEHLAARSACAVFDVSHISKFRICGNGALAWLEAALSSKVADCCDGAGMRTLLTDAEGRIVDRMMLMRESAGSFLLLGHAGMEAIDAARLEALKPHAALELRDETDAWCTMVLMGPQCEQVLARVLRGAELPVVGHFTRFFYQNHELMLSRLGLEDETESERAYEFFCPAVSGISWFESFLSAGAQPCGAATRESLRLERGCVAVGSDIVPHRSTPGQMNLGRLCHPEKQQAEEKAPGERIARLRCMESGRAAPEAGSAVRDTSGNTVGRVTGAAFSPAMDGVVAMALLAAPFVQPGMHLVIMMQGRAVPAEVV